MTLATTLKDLPRVGEANDGRLFPLSRHHRTQLLILVGVVLIWELLATTIFAHRFVLPTPTSIAQTAWSDHFYGSDLLTTLSEASLGWIIGNGLGLLLAGFSLISPRLEKSLLSFGVLTYAVPTVAIGPILFIIQSPFAAKVTMSALSVFFVTLTAGLVGLRQSSKTAIEMVTAFGGSKFQVLQKVRIRASTPAVASGLCISAPAAILGAIIGDYFGGQSGLGVVMLQSQQQLAVARTWAIALVTTLVSGGAYTLTLYATKRFGAGTATTAEAGEAFLAPPSGGLRSIFIALARLIVGIIAGLIIWDLAIHASGLGGYFLKSPLAVYQYLFVGGGAAANRSEIISAFGITLMHAGTGWLLGTVVAISGAVVLVLFPTLSAAVMPFVLIIRSVPLVAMTPLLALLFGRGLIGITVIAGLVTLVPTLVTVADGLRQVPPSSIDLISAIGGSRFQVLMSVRRIYAIPSIFAAAKISMPGAMLGAVLAEWMVGSSGIGHAMAYDVIGSNFGNLWAAIAVIVSISLIAYFVVNAIETSLKRKLAIS
ncbi:MAG: ABC transporter permease subunit [Actinomycetota bacterium]|nr:ABC transporter permease subunit [Actinomycetota bacterium]